MTRPIVRKAERWPWVWAAIVTVLLVALAGALIAYLHASSAITCTNDALGTRSVVGTSDATLNGVLNRPAGQLVTDTDANLAVYAELLSLQRSAAPATRAERDRFFVVIQHVKRVLDANQKYRSDNPIGQC